MRVWCGRKRGAFGVGAELDSSETAVGRGQIPLSGTCDVPGALHVLISIIIMSFTDKYNIISILR